MVSSLNMSSQGTNEQMKKNSKFKQKFKQQRLPAWQPILTADTVLPAFFLIGLLFIPLGVALLYFSNNVQEKQIDYTNCTSNGHGGLPCQNVIEGVNFTLGKDSCICEIPFTLNQTFEKNVYIYYGLDNFYQNHRRYVKSRDDNQLYGNKISTKTADSSCAPFNTENGQIYAPCGAIANSLFNDTLVILDVEHSGQIVGVLDTGIAWHSDKTRKFRNPPGDHNESSPNFAFKDTVQPKYWVKPVYELDADDWSNNGYVNEDLIVWMRTAAFPAFRKLYRRVDHSKGGFKNGMPQGDYILRVNYNYPVQSFGGSKRFIISTTSFLGGKNNFLGIAYITVGAICLLLGVIFLIIHIKFGKRPSDLQNITQNTPYTSD